MSSVSTIFRQRFSFGSAVVQSWKDVPQRIARARFLSESGGALTNRNRKPDKMQSAAIQFTEELPIVWQPSSYAHRRRLYCTPVVQHGRRRVCVLNVGERMIERIVSGAALSLLYGFIRVVPYNAPCGCFGNRVRFWQLIPS